MINRNQSRLIAKELRNAARRTRRKDVTYGVRVGSQHRLKVDATHGTQTPANKD